MQIKSSGYFVADLMSFFSKTVVLASIIAATLFYPSGAFTQEAEKEETPPAEPPAEEPREFGKYENPTGIQIGRVDPDSGASLPDEVRELAEAGAIASSKGEWQAAYDAYTEMIRKVPRNALAYANLGIVEYRMERYERAKEDLLSSLALNPTIAQNWMTLGLCYFQLGDLNLAIASLARAKHADPDDPNGYVYMAIVTEAYGWGNAAEVELKRALELEPNFADAHYNLALHYLGQAPPALELARRHYYRAIDLGAPEDESIEEQLDATPESAPTTIAP